MSYQFKGNLSSLDNNSGYYNDKGNHECVVLVQKVIEGVPETTLWKKGVNVKDSVGLIKRGTVIATLMKKVIIQQNVLCMLRYMYLTMCME